MGSGFTFISVNRTVELVFQEQYDLNGLPMPGGVRIMPVFL